MPDLEAAQARVRTATQLIIETIGSSGGPEDLEEALGRMVAQLSTLRALVEEVLNAGCAFEDWRIPYKEVQIDRDWFDRARATYSTPEMDAKPDNDNLRATVADRERQLWEMSQALYEERERRASAT